MELSDKAESNDRSASLAHFALRSLRRRLDEAAESAAAWAYHAKGEEQARALEAQAALRRARDIAG